MPAKNSLKKVLKPKYKQYAHYEKLFHINTLLCVGDLKKHMAYIEKRFNSTHDRVQSLAGFYVRFDEEFDDGIDEVYVIYLRSLDDFYTLSHELIHLCREALVDRGVGADLDIQDETFAYLHTHLLQVMWKKMGAWIGLKKKPLPLKK